MAILKIAKLGHPVLIKKTNEINDLNKVDLKKIIFDMSQTMLDANGIVLAAPQVHLSQRMFIYRNTDIEEEDNIYSIVTNLSCPKCYSFVEVYYPNEATQKEYKEYAKNN